MNDISSERIICIIDDEPAIRDSLQVFLQCLDLDLTVELFSSANDFIDYLKKNEVSIPPA